MITVYFDTSFYVNLARADDLLADRVLDELNAMKVRHVISMRIFSELFSSKPRTIANHSLFGRVSRLLIQPLNLNPGLNWKSLIAPPLELEALAKMFRDIDDRNVTALSYSLVAERKLSAEQQELLKKANPQFERITEQENDGKAFVGMLSQILATLASAGFGLDFSRAIELLNAPEHDFLAIADVIKSALPKEALSRLDEQSKICQSVTVSDNRLFDVVTGNAKSKQKKRLANTLRDGSHMSLFAEHAESIDFLQVDGPQMEQIRKSSPRHRLSELGLAKRCFTLDSISDTADTIRRLMTEGVGQPKE